MTAHYQKDGGQFHFHDDLVKMDDASKPVVDKDGEFVREQKLVHSSPSIAVAYCRLPDRLHIFTHGTAEAMKAWAAAHNTHSPHKAELRVFDQNTPLDVVNAVIISPEALAKFL